MMPSAVVKLCSGIKALLISSSVVSSADSKSSRLPLLRQNGKLQDVWESPLPVSLESFQNNTILESWSSLGNLNSVKSSIGSASSTCWLVDGSGWSTFSSELTSSSPLGSFSTGRNSSAEWLWSWCLSSSWSIVKSRIYNFICSLICRFNFKAV